MGLGATSLVEFGYLSLNKKGEELCGDHVEATGNIESSSRTFVLADGLGSGVQANILSTLTSTMLSRMIEGGVSIEESVEAVVKTLPVSKSRGNVAYSTFSICKLAKDDVLYVYNYDNPFPVYLRHGKELSIPIQEVMVEGKKISFYQIHMEEDDALVFMSDGVLYAGVGETMNFGWGRDEIVHYLEALYDSSISAKNLATLLVDHCSTLYNHRPGDDTTALVIKKRPRVAVSVMVGPPTNPEDDEKVMRLFFARGGKHIVCGGTSTKVVARYLDKPILTDLDYLDKDIPPISHVEGVDLVTEGVITLNRVLQMAKDYLGPNGLYFEWTFRQDGASLLAKTLFEEASDISFFVGCAVNPAHQDPRYHIDITMKMQIVEELTKALKEMGKLVKVAYF